jgi:NAD(P)-dependent dehydrogenase (short-subunit alcohol dehydrogenase family)
MEISLAGKVALVTGAGPNIGGGIALALAALGNFLNTKHAGRYMAEHGIRGSIVAISSSNGWSGSAGVIAYAFHKGGANNFVRAAAMDLAPYGIRVNSFTPTAPTPDNPELIAEQGPGGVLYRPPPVGGLGSEGGNEQWRRPARWIDITGELDRELS